MRIPMKVDYGVRALVDLAEHGDGRLIQTAEVARRQNIPEPYLERLLATLHRAGLVSSRRGSRGGHALAKLPSEINLDMVLTSMEANSPALDCIPEPAECSLSDGCAQRDVWRDLEETVKRVLVATSIADLAERQRPAVSQGRDFI